MTPPALSRVARARSVCAAVFLTLAAVPALAQPTPPEVAAAITSALTAMGRPPGASLQVRAVTACYPGTGTGAPWLLCLVEMNDRNGAFGVQHVPVRRVSGRWQMHEVTGLPSPACPSKADAEALFQAAMGKAARVTDTPEEGSLTDQRGMNREKTGPLRLMCTYEVTRSFGAATVVAYFGYANGKYTLDRDYEVWP